jgi:hypothetical protein
MNTRCLALTIAFAALAITPALAQTASTAPAPPRTPTAAPAEVAVPDTRRNGQPINVKVDVTIADQRGGAAALKKTVSVVTGDRMTGFIRSTANYTNLGDVPLNVDVEPELIPSTDGKIRVRVNLQYDLPGGAQTTDMPGAGTLRKTQIRENLAVVLDNGKAIVVAQSADPVGDRQVTIEVKATILK